MEDRPKDSAIEKFFASRIGLARIGSFKQLENKLKNQKGKFPSFAINLALDDDVLFSAATKVDLLPPIEEAQEGLLYIKKPENLLFFPSLDTDPKEWIPIAGTGGAGGTVTIQQGKVDDVKVDGVSVLNTATKIANIDLSNKVDKVTGKGLSTNDFTNELKTKLDAIETNAQKNKIEVIKDAGGQVIPINNGEVRLPASATVDAYTKAEANTRFVEKENNKVLSSNDFTNALKTKLENLNENAEANLLNGVKTHDGVELPINDKKITLPDFALKSDLSSVYKVKGSKASYLEIDAITNKNIGDVYNATDTGSNYVWTGTEWDNLGGTIDLTNYYNKTQLDTKLDTKVDKEAGKGLSTNDFTNDLKAKLENISNNANKNVQVDWNEADTDSDAFIKNKPTIPAGSVLYASTGTHTDGAIDQKTTTDELNKKVDKEIGKTLTSNDFTTELKDKLTAIEASAQVNKIEEIKTADGVALAIANKSITLPAAAAAIDAYTKTQSDDKYIVKETGKTLTSNDFTNELKTKLEGVANNANKNVQADWNEVDTNSDSFIKNKPVIPAGSVLYDATGAHTDGSITQKVVTEELNKKVDKVDGKGLSTNDFTNELKDKLNAVNENGEANVLNGIKTADGNELTITDKKITLPNFALKSDISSVYKVKGSKANKAELDDIVDKEVGDVYNLADTGVNYVWTGTEWDSLSGNVDLTGYYTKTQADDKFVVKEAGKGLSDNNFTLMDKAKLGNIEMYAQVNKIEEIQTHDGTPLTITDKKVKLPELTVDAYTKAQADGKFVAKETGKGLSTNDLTNDLKAKIENAKNGGAYLSTTRLEQTIGQSKVIAIGSVNGLTIDKVVENGTLIYDDNNGIGVVEEIAGNALKVKTISLGSITNTKNDIQLTYSQDFYSQQEQTVGFYMGKPLYQITIPKLFPSKPNSTQEVGAIPGLERVVEVDGVIMNASSQVSYMISHQEMGGTKFINITGNSNDGKILITVGSAMPNGPYLVELTVKYTKKTDAAANENAMPLNNLLINRPDLWKLNKTYSFGNFVAGARFRGVVQTGKTILDIPTSMVGQPFPLQPTTIVNSNIVIYNGGTERDILSSGYYGQNNFIGGLYIPSLGQIKFAFETSDDYVGKSYDAWVLFKPNGYGN